LGLLREFLALAVSLEHLGSVYNNPKALVFGRRSSQINFFKTINLQLVIGQIDNRGSHFYLAMYWAEALAAQTKDQGCKLYLLLLQKN
jgi:isocitrate dehydrogenase